MKDTRPHIRPPGPPGGLELRRGCDAPGCEGLGEHRAPRSRDRLTEYYWFCLEHVREYNARWNYFAGMTSEQIERHVRADVTWQRPTWPLGVFARHKHTQASDGPHIHWGAFAAEEWDREQAQAREANPDARWPRPGSEEERALAVFDMAPPVTRAEIKARYKVLAKRHHPDANGGDRSAEERLKAINQAYTALMGSTLLA